jgi:ficolin
MQRRVDGSVDFYRNWTEYKNGFGKLTGEFWLGLDKIHRLSANGQNVLRVDLESFENETRYANFGTFAVGNENEGYILSIGQYTGKKYFQYRTFYRVFEFIRQIQGIIRC